MEPTERVFSKHLMNEYRRVMGPLVSAYDHGEIDHDTLVLRYKEEAKHYLDDYATLMRVAEASLAPSRAAIDLLLRQRAAFRKVG